MRTIIDLEDRQIAALSAFCEREKISRAEAIRRAVDALLAENAEAEKKEAFGSWEPRGDSRTVVDTIREEWSR